MDDFRQDPLAGGAAHVRNDPVTVFQKSGKFVTALLESASQAIISIDRTGQIVLINGRAEEIFGYSREELIGAPIEMLLPDSKRSSHRHDRDDYFARPRARPMGIGMDLSGRRKDGTDVPVEVSLSCVEIDEGVFAIAFVSDISQRKQLEEQLLHAQKMEAVGRLAGGVAHDFNNMLTVIAGYNRMILDELSTMDPLRGYAEEILKAADRAGALTNQLLAFSRRQIMQPRVINVNAVLAQTEKMLHRLIGEDVELVLNLGRNVGNIKADPGHVEQAIVNLAVNARDAMPLGGRITIETADVFLDEHYARTHMGVKPGEFAMLAVSDTGHGMDAETRRHIFEPFFTTKERGKGTGLGLATVYGMIKQTGGDIWVYSEPGQGTTFKLYFPRVCEPISDSSDGDGASAKGSGGETILVVEDEKAVLELTVRILQRLGYTILTAGGGAEALEISQTYAGHIDLLLTDVVMPNMSGRQLADQLQESRPATKVLFLSGYTENTVVHHGVLDAGVDFLPKPFSRENLSKKLREVLARA
jgi:two-component system cell cycle sensor histidine kinase/response regulator CckA